MDDTWAPFADVSRNWCAYHDACIVNFHKSTGIMTTSASVIETTSLSAFGINNQSVTVALMAREPFGRCG